MGENDDTRANWSRLFDLLDSVLELPPDDRDPWIEQLEDVPQALKDRLRQLLAERSRFEQEEFLARPALPGLGAGPRGLVPPVLKGRAPEDARPAAAAAAVPRRQTPPSSPAPPERKPSAAPAGGAGPPQARPSLGAQPDQAPRVPRQAPKGTRQAAPGGPREPQPPTVVRDISILPSRDHPVPRVGKSIKGRYTLVEELGQGGMGHVFKARDERRVEAEDRNPYVALKVLSDEFKEHPDAFIALQREGKRAQDLAHPNVVTVFDFDRDGPLVFMTMEYLQGKALDVHLRTDFSAGLSVAAAWPIIRGIGAALEYGHSKKIIHSDMKPSNVFICRDGGVKVLDFGIARPMTTLGDAQAEVTNFDPGKRLGSLTPAYASLEMWSRDAPDPRDDIYAFACLTYELLVGRHPFDKMSARTVRDEHLTPKRIDSISRAQWDALKKGLALHRDHRTPTVAQFIAPFAPSSFMRRHGLSVAGAATVAAVAGLVLGAHYFRAYIEDELIGDSSDITVPVSTVVLTPAQKQDIEDKLVLAEEFFSGVKLSATPDDMVAALSEGANNVNQILDDVLNTDPGNREALILKGKVADLLSRKAHQLADAGDVQEAATVVKAGLRVRPKHRELFRLQRELCRNNAAAC